MTNLEGTVINFEGHNIILDENPYELDSKFFEDYWFVAEGHDTEGNRYNVYWVKKATDELDVYTYDLDDPEKIEKIYHYEVEVEFAGTSEHGYATADGFVELAWELTNIDNNGAAYLDKITIYAEDMPNEFEETFGWKYRWEVEKSKGKITLNIG